MATPDLSIRILGPQDASILDKVAADVFDGAIDPHWSAEFLADARHHLAVALSGNEVVGMASAVHYVHPDKPPELWINEVGVASGHRGQGIGRRLLDVLLEHGRALGCQEAWVLTDRSNGPARRLYAALGGHESTEPIVMVSFQLGAAKPRPDATT